MSRFTYYGFQYFMSYKEHDINSICYTMILIRMLLISDLKDVYKIQKVSWDTKIIRRKTWYVRIYE